MKTIVILMDSLNKRFLPPYGNEWVKTPNIDRLAQKCRVFDSHFVGSAPCMPARHDLLTGRLEFLERNWSPIQPFDCTLPYMLKKNGIFSHMVTDHYHYFHIGGENYFAIFDSWDFIRGQEHDTMVSNLGYMEGRPHYGQYHSQYERNRATFGGEEDYPSPKTLAHAAEWVDRHANEDNWMLMVDSFDPHEPFDVPDDFLNLYGDDYKDKLYYWPEYASTDGLSEEALEHIRKRYAAVLSMSDKWLGKLLDVCDRHSLWDDTMIVLTTDHGYMLGEKQLMAKNYMPAYNEIYNIPLMIHLPGMDSQTRCDALTQNIDLYPTILEFLGIDSSTSRDKLHGKSLMPMLRGESEKVRDYVIYGMFGRQVNICDGRYTYFRSAVRSDNRPLSVYTAMPSTINHYWDHDHIRDVTKIEAGRFLKWTDYPVFKIPCEQTMLADFSHNFDIRYDIVSKNMLFDIINDCDQNMPLNSPEIEQEMCQLLIRALKEHDSPDEQFIRLGLEEYNSVVI